MAGERKIVADNLKRALLKQFVMQETRRAGFGGLDIQRTPMGTRITLFAERPGIVIGRRGVNIKELTTNVDRGFDLDNPQIEVEEVAYPALNAQIMAEKLGSALERGWHFRRAGHSTLRRIMFAGAKGALIRISGKLTSQRHRTEKFKAGHIKYNGEPKNLFVDQGFAVAKLKRGVIGVTVWITDPNAKLPDEIEVLAVESPEEGPAEAEVPAGREAPEAEASATPQVEGTSEETPTEPEKPPEEPGEEAEGAVTVEAEDKGPTPVEGKETAPPAKEPKASTKKGPKGPGDEKPPKKAAKKAAKAPKKAKKAKEAK